MFSSFWNWGPTTIWHNMTCGQNCFQKSLHPTVYTCLGAAGSRTLDHHPAIRWCRPLWHLPTSHVRVIRNMLYWSKLRNTLPVDENYRNNLKGAVTITIDRQNWLSNLAKISRTDSELYLHQKVHFVRPCFLSKSNIFPQSLQTTQNVFSSWMFTYSHSLQIFRSRSMYNCTLYSTVQYIYSTCRKI